MQLNLHNFTEESWSTNRISQHMTELSWNNGHLSLNTVTQFLQ